MLSKLLSTCSTKTPAHPCCPTRIWCPWLLAFLWQHLQWREYVKLVLFYLLLKSFPMYQALQIYCLSPRILMMMPSFISLITTLHLLLIHIITSYTSDGTSFLVVMIRGGLIWDLSFEHRAGTVIWEGLLVVRVRIWTCGNNGATWIATCLLMAMLLGDHLGLIMVKVVGLTVNERILISTRCSCRLIEPIRRMRRWNQSKRVPILHQL